METEDPSFLCKICQQKFFNATAHHFHEKWSHQFEDLNMPNLSIFLNSRYASIQNQKWTCDICNESFTKKASLASHKKKHKTDKTLTPKNMEEIELCMPVENVIISTRSVTEVVAPLNEGSKKKHNKKATI